MVFGLLSFFCSPACLLLKKSSSTSFFCQQQLFQFFFSIFLDFLDPRLVLTLSIEVTSSTSAPPVRHPSFLTMRDVSSAAAAATARPPSPPRGPPAHYGALGDLDSADHRDPEDQLRKLMPKVGLCTEAPSPANGGVFQVRTTVGQAVFIGRGASKEAARAQCCRNAVRWIRRVV